MTFNEKLIEFAKRKPAIELDGKVQYKQTKFKYATLGQIIDKVTPVLSELGLGFWQGMDMGMVVTEIYEAGGEGLIASRTNIPVATNPQDLGKWITYVKRYQLCAMLGIVGEDDVDGQLAQRNKERDAEEENRKEVRKRIKIAINNAASILKLNEIEARMDAIGFNTDAEIQSLIMQKRDSL